MSVRRQAMRVVTVGALLGGLVAVGALPAYGGLGPGAGPGLGRLLRRRFARHGLDRGA